MEINIKKPEIKNYRNYRAFLKDYADYRRILSNNKWSLGFWSKQLGLKTNSGLSMILSGQRHAGDSVVKKLLEYFNFSESDEKYFLDLIRIQKMTKEDHHLTVLILEDKKQDSEKKPKAPSLEVHWLVDAMSEMVYLEDYQHDIEWIQKRLIHEVGIEEITKVFEYLKENEITYQSQNGKFCRSLKAKNNPKKATPITREDLLAHLKDLLGFVVDAFDLPQKDRRFLHLTLPFNKEKMQEARDYIMDFQAKFRDKFTIEPMNEVYQLQIQFYPLTKSQSPK